MVHSRIKNSVFINNYLILMYILTFAEMYESKKIANDIGPAFEKIQVYGTV